MHNTIYNKYCNISCRYTVQFGMLTNQSLKITVGLHCFKGRNANAYSLATRSIAMYTRAIWALYHWYFISLPISTRLSYTTQFWIQLKQCQLHCTLLTHVLLSTVKERYLCDDNRLATMWKWYAPPDWFRACYRPIMFLSNNVSLFVIIYIIPAPTKNKTTSLTTMMSTRTNS